MAYADIIAGQRFNSLTAIKPLPKEKGNPNARPRWLFLCDCGKKYEALRSAVVSGRTRQCIACGHKEQGRKIAKHGLHKTREFHRFYQAKARCTNPNNARYAEYGGRGIQWRFESHEQAYAELGPCPPGRTLDRIDNNGHYEPSNVRWATRQEQYASRRPWNWAKNLAA